MENLQELKPVGKLTPFAHFCCTIGNLPTSYMISLTYEEQLLWLCNYLEKTVIPAVNTNAEAVAELQKLYIQLKEYVDNYFTNLDVQQEINNKLNEMAQDGTLARIINQEIFTELNNQVQENTQNIQALQAHDMYVDVVAEGIINNGTDVTANLQNLINKFPQGATFYFKNGIYLFKNIELFSNTTILGDTNTKFVINDDKINKQFIVKNKENINFKNCYFKNGTTHEQDLIGSAVEEINMKCCIYLENTKNIIIEKCHFDTISGACFINCLNVENFKLFNSILENSAYSMLSKLSFCKNFYIDKNIFQNAFTGSTGNSYMISAGVLNYETDNGYSDNIHITNNIFRNHKKWETIDSHGGTNYYIENNKFYECYQPIAIFDDVRANRTFNMENINVIDNFIEVNGTLEDFIQYAITIHGNSDTMKPITHGKVVGNTILSKNGNAIGGITVRYANNFEISNNYGYGLHFYCLVCYNFINGYILNNTFENSLNDTSQRTCDFLFNGVHNTEVVNNTTHSIQKPLRAIQLSTPCYIKNYDKNNFEWLADIQFRIYPFENARRYGVLGSEQINQNSNYPWKHASNRYLQSVAKENVCTFKTTEGSYIVESSINFLSVIAIGENIEIVGAGINGENIQAQVVEYIDGTHLKLSKQMYQTLNNAQVNTLDATWVDN